MKGSFMQYAKPHEGTLGTWGTIFAFMSTVVGGGIVSIPWSMYQTGFPQGMLLSVFATLQVLLMSFLFLKARELCPSMPQSLYEQGFILIGRQSIFIISFLTFVQSFGLIVIFMGIFGSTLAQLLTNIFWSDVPEDQANFGMKKECWVIVLALLLFPSVLKKELAELKIISAALFLSAICFVIMTVVQIGVRGNSEQNPDSDYKMYWKANFTNNYIQAAVIILQACNFSINLFPIHSHQIDKSLKGSMRNIVYSMLII